MNRRWLALIVGALGAVVIAPLVFLVLASPTAAPTASAPTASAPDASPPHASVAPSEPAPTSSAAAAITFVAASSPEDASWYRIGGERQQIPPAIQVGTVSGGVTFELEIHQNPIFGPDAIVPQRPVLGVADGVVVIVEDDGSRSVLRAVVAADGDEHELLESSDVIVDGVLAPDGRDAFFVTADRLTGDLTGVWRLAIEAGAEPEPLEHLVAAVPEIRLVAVTRFFTRMLLSADGTTLGLFRCIELDCAFRTIRVHDGSFVGEVRLERGGGSPFALTDNSVLLRPIVPDGPYRIGEVVDIVSGQRTPLPFEGWPFASEVILDWGDGPMLVARTAGFNVPIAPGMQSVVTIIDLADLEVVRELTPPLGFLRVPAGDDYSVGADLPPGWLLIQGSEPGEVHIRCWALNLADGSLIPLPAVGRFAIQP